MTEIQSIVGSGCKSFNTAMIVAAMQAMQKPTTSLVEAMNKVESSMPSTINGLAGFKNTFLGGIPPQFQKQHKRFVKPTYTGSHFKVLKGKKKAAKASKRRNR